MIEEKKVLPSLWNQDWKKVKLEIKKVKKLLNYINISLHNWLIQPTGAR